MKIYTKTGDKGQTGLFGGKRIAKNSIRVEAIGTIDELNSAIGVVIAMSSSRKRGSRSWIPDRVGNDKVKKELIYIQQDLFEIGAYLATPKDVVLTKGQQIHKTLSSYLEHRTLQMESLIDTLTQSLKPMQAFILPGGGEAGSLLHLTRSISRRAERRVVEFATKERVLDEVLMYLNRLSDLLFTMARFVNAKEKKKETEWKKQ